jgi:hypothetical protein
VLFGKLRSRQGEMPMKPTMLGAALAAVLAAGESEK